MSLPKALNSLSVQILIIGALVCTGMYWGVNKDTTLVTIFASGFTGLVIGRKVRDGIQASNNVYYDDNDKKLKSINQNETG